MYQLVLISYCDIDCYYCFAPQAAISNSVGATRMMKQVEEHQTAAATAAAVVVADAAVVAPTPALIALVAPRRGIPTIGRQHHPHFPVIGFDS